MSIFVVLLLMCIGCVTSQTCAVTSCLSGECAETNIGPACYCPTGYIGEEVENNLLCTNIDECSQTNTACVPAEYGGLCSDTEGSYTCSCHTGFEGDGVYLGDGCSDENECLVPDRCEGECINTVGSYYCTCTLPLKLADDQHSCITPGVCDDESLCPNGNCVDDGGVLKCACNIGFKEDLSNVCSDDDECDTIPCPNGHCHNTMGSFICYCDEGYMQDSSRQCIDIDECTEKSHLCNAKSSCKNEDGSYNCVCDEGYQHDDTKLNCFDIDECELRVHLPERDPCVLVDGERITCQNYEGGFYCVCPPGYTGSGKKSDTNCTDIDECESGNRCTDEPHEMCVNIAGSYECHCEDGFERNEEEMCENINECEQANDCGDEHDCVDTDGSYLCKCNSLHTADDTGDTRENCHLNGGYGPYEVTAHCSKPCDGGAFTEERKCDNPSPALPHGDGGCVETEVHSENCHDNSCSNGVLVEKSCECHQHQFYLDVRFDEFLDSLEVNSHMDFHAILELFESSFDIDYLKNDNLYVEATSALASRKVYFLVDICADISDPALCNLTSDGLDGTELNTWLNEVEDEIVELEIIVESLRNKINCNGNPSYDARLKEKYEDAKRAFYRHDILRMRLKRMANRQMLLHSLCTDPSYSSFDMVFKVPSIKDLMRFNANGKYGKEKEKKDDDDDDKDKGKDDDDDDKDKGKDDDDDK